MACNINPDKLYKMAEAIEAEKRTRVIYKYAGFQIGQTNRLSVPVGSKILTAQMQNGVLTLWVLHEFVTGKTLVKDRHIFITGTGHEIEHPIDSMRFISTVQIGPLVWHVFEIIELGRFDDQEI